MEETRFRIVFEKLSEAVASEAAAGDQQPVVEQLSSAEYDEIDELRRLSLELSEPEPVVYTTA
jgi:hypothetical protein